MAVYSRTDVENIVRRQGVPHGHVRTQIAGHGAYQCTATSLDTLIENYWHRSVRSLVEEVKERQGDPEYDTHGLAKIELIMIIAELSGLATN